MAIKYACNECGGDTVTRDAWAEWDMEAQNWVLGAVYDYAFCHDCEEETRLVEHRWKGEPPPTPVISIFFGIVIRMYFDDHPPPHFHATYQGFEAFVSISTGEVSEGRLPKKAARIVRQWALDHGQELMANWQRGVDLLPMEMIVGADIDD